MDDEFFASSLANKYESWELCELLNIPVETFIDRFWAELTENYQELMDQMRYGC